MDNTDLQMAASAIEQSDTSEMDGKYLTFWTDGQLFGVPIADVVQIVGMQNITNIPEFPHYAKGVINLRGSIIPLIDMRLRLAKQEAPYDERTCIIVTNIEQRDVGLTVKITPRINPSGNVILTVEEKFEDVLGSQTIQDQSWPTVTTRKLSADVSVGSGETVILGGLVKTSKSEDSSGIPLLKDIKAATPAPTPPTT